jgi:hypothetical protein
MSILPTSLILVAVINQPRDMEIARLLGWYRIPLRTAPKVIAVDHLAFYQTGALGGGKGKIQYTAPVRGHELTTRAELLRDESDHPRAREEYYKIQLGPLECLPHPIPAGKWHRVTFLYTTGDYLYHAKDLNELVVQSEERKTLWQALRDRANQAQDYQAGELPGVDLEPDLLAMLLGIAALPTEKGTGKDSSPSQAKQQNRN